MSFADLSARFKKKQEEKAPAPVERDHAQVNSIRARMLGVLLRDARIANDRSPADMARELNISEAQINDWELGNTSPSLPELEVIAYYLDIPVSQFWNDKTLTSQTHERAVFPKEQYNELRDRMIGLKLAMARKDAKLSQEELALAVGTTPDQVNAYEYGQQPIPFPLLTALSSSVRKSLSYFLDDTGRVGNWLQIQEEYRRFSELPPEVRAFAAQPNNQPFIEIAMRLSAMPLQELRTVAEKILDITL